MQVVCLSVSAKILADSQHQSANMYDVKTPPDDTQLSCHLQPSSLPSSCSRHCGAEARHSWPVMSMSKVHGCFILLCFGMVGYAAIDN